MGRGLEAVGPTCHAGSPVFQFLCLSYLALNSITQHIAKASLLHRNVLDEARELRLMLCRERRSTNSGRTSAAVTAACGELQLALLMSLSSAQDVALPNWGCLFMFPLIQASTSVKS